MISIRCYALLNTILYTTFICSGIPLEPTTAALDIHKMNIETIVPDISETLDTQSDAALPNVTDTLALTMRVKNKLNISKLHFSNLSAALKGFMSNPQIIPQATTNNFAIINKQLLDTQDAFGQADLTLHTILQQLENFYETFDILPSFEHRLERIENDQNKPTSDSSLYVIDPQSPTHSTQDRGCPEAHASLEKLESLYDCYNTSYDDYSPIPEAESNIVALP